MHSSKMFRRGRVLSAAVAAVGLLAAVERAPAINIILVYNAGASTEPAGDPTGALLTDIMQHIDSTYTDIFEDLTANSTLTINYWYEELGASTLGVHNLLTEAGGRETSCNIRFDPDAVGSQWFFDTTPADNSEFDMSQVLWRDLTPTQQTDFYNPGANIPQTFEAGFRGADNGTDPNTNGNTDLLSVAFHEVGHALGMSGSNNSTVTETGDDDYDFDAVNIFGVTHAVETAGGTNIAHLQSTFALMNPTIGTDFRDLPSHTDLLAMAAVHNYVALDMPRREYYGGSDWNTDANWTGNTVPSSADEVFVRAAGPANEIRNAGLTANGFVGILNISEGASVQTNTFSLSVFDTLNIDGASSDFFVEAGGTLSATGSVINTSNTGQLSMNGGVISSVGTINNDAEIVGDGTINVSGRLNNSGSINVVTGTLLINATGTGSINLDGFAPTIFGSESGIVNVNTAGSDLVVNGLLSDNFNGVMNIGNSNSVTMNDPWTLGGVGSSGTILILGSDGVLNLNGGTTSATAAVLAGATATIEGDVNVGTTNYGLITAPVVFESTPAGGAEVVVNGTLELDNTATYLGGSHTGTGRLVWDGNVFITGDTTIDIAELDLDGFVPVAELQINNGITLTVNSLITDPPSGTIDIQGSMLVNGGAWTNGGTVILNTGIIGGTSAYTNSGSLNVLAGVSSITTNSTFTTLSNTTITGRLTLLGNLATIAGGTWGGAGSLTLDSLNTTFTANTAFNMGALDLDGAVIGGTGSINLNSGVTVVVNSDISDAFDATLNVNSATFNVTSGPFTSNPGAVVNLTDTGAGTATFLAPGFLNSSGATINFAGGASSGFTEGGGEGGSGGPEAITGGGRMGAGAFINDGRVNVGTNSGGVITGAATFNASSSVVINTGGQLVLAGASTFNGGAFTGAGILTQDGNVTVVANTTIGVATYDWDGDFFGTTTVNPGVTFTINSTTVENDGNAHDSAITLASGTVVVNTAGPWLKGDTMFLINTGVGVPNVAGQDMVLSGVVTTTGATQMTAGLINASGTLNTTAGSTHTNTGAFRTTVAPNTFTKTGPGTWNINGPQAHVAGAILNIDNGSVNMAQDAGGGGMNLSLLHSGTMLNMAANQHLARLTIDTGATATMTGAGNDNVLRVGSLTITGGANPTGTLNLADENMIIDHAGASPLIAVRDWLLSGYAANTWNGDGIRSSFAAADPNNRALGYAEASAIGSPPNFAGEAIDNTTVLVRLTLPGDGNLNRTVDINDFSILGANFNTPQFWTGGDFDYNFFVNIGDFSLLASHFNQSIPSDLPRGAAVPEPAAAGALIAGALLMRRRRS